MRGHRPVTATAACYFFSALTGIIAAACGSGSSVGADEDGGAVIADDGAAGTDGPTPFPTDAGEPADAPADAAPVCVPITDVADTALLTAGAAGEYVLTLPARSTSKTSWGAAQNEALILEVRKNGALLAHVVIHQGQAQFAYSMHTGALAKGDVLTARVSTLSAVNAARSAAVCGPSLVTAASFGAMADAITHAPIYVWPIPKRFDDMPLVVSYARASKEFVSFFTNENGGTTQLCGGGADGLTQEIRLWGRGADIESSYNAGTNVFERCPNASGTGTLRMESAHPFLYYSNGHNNLFEDRSGYGSSCGSSSDNKADGDFPGWGSAASGPGDDAKYSVVLRPVPFDSDAIAYSLGGAPRERVLSSYAPWFLRLTGLEVGREGKVDNVETFTFDRYLHADVYVADVDGPNFMCPPTLQGGGFVLRSHTKDGATDSAGRITTYSCSGQQWKHVSIPLAATHAAADFDQLVFDAYDNDGIYILAIGDVYVLAADRDNGATLGVVRKGAKVLGQYVDDDQSGCVAGMSTYNGKMYPCVANLYSFAP